VGAEGGAALKGGGGSAKKKTRLKVSIYTREPLHSKLPNDKNMIESIKSIQTD